MTEFIDDVRAVVSELHTRMTAEDGFDEWKKTIPGSEMIMRAHKDKLFRTIRRVRQRFVGGSPFESPEEAIERTKKPIWDATYGDLSTIFGTGIVAGKINLVTAISDLDMVAKLAKDELTPPPEMMLSFYDEDVRELLWRLFQENSVHYAAYTGYINMDQDGVDKIWDQWALQTGTMGLIFYVLGCTMGRMIREREAFSGLIEENE